MSGKVQRGRWNKSQNVLKQDRIIYNDEGYAVGYHDGCNGHKKYKQEGFSIDFYAAYDRGYDEAISDLKYSRDSAKETIAWTKNNNQVHAKKLPIKNLKRQGCLAYIFGCIIVMSCVLVMII